ncbi:MAG: hypothetical protein ACXVHB_05925 [Solirubrobacteraceae bacterium]
MQGPRLYRFFNYENILYLPAPTGGWNTDAPLWEMPENQAPILDNFIIKPGKIRLRAPISVYTKFTATPLFVGGWVGGFGTSAGADWWYLSRRSNVAGCVDPWHSPLVHPQVVGDLTSGITTLQKSVSAAAGTLVVGSADAIPGPRWINFDGLLYGISLDSAGAIAHDSNSSYVIKPLSLLTLPPVQTGSTAPTVLSNAPHGAFDLKGYQSRIWLLGGVDTPGAGTVHSSIALFYTNPIVAGGGTASADWKDPVAGTTNLIKMDGDASDYGVGLALVRNGMLVFRRRSIWLLRGSTTSNYALVPVTRDLGCVDARSIVESDQGVYFLSDRGLMLTNGVTVKNVSGGVEEDLTDAIQRQMGDILSRSAVGAHFSAAMSQTGHILISIGSYNSGGGQYGGLWTGVYDTINNAWSRFTSQLWISNEGTDPSGFCPQLMQSPDQLKMRAVGDQYLAVLEERANATNTSAFMPGRKGDNALYDIQDGTHALGIPAEWQTRIAPTVGTAAMTRKMSQAKRYFVDYTFAYGTYASGTSMTVFPADVTDAFFPTGLNLPPASGFSTYRSESGPNAGFVGGRLAPAKIIQRASADEWREFQDITFTVRYNDLTQTAPATSVLLELYGIGLESQRTRELR